MCLGNGILFRPRVVRTTSYAKTLPRLMFNDIGALVWTPTKSVKSPDKRDNSSYPHSDAWTTGGLIHQSQDDTSKTGGERAIDHGDVAWDDLGTSHALALHPHSEGRGGMDDQQFVEVERWRLSVRQAEQPWMGL